MAGEEDVGSLAVKLAMDDSSFQQGLQNLKRNMSVIDSSFKESVAGLKDWGKNVDALQSNASALGEKIELQRQVVEKYQKQLEKSKDTLEKNAKAMSEAMVDLKPKIDEAKIAWQESAKAEGENSEATKALKKTYDELNKQYTDAEQKVRNNVKSIDGYTIQLNTAEAKLKSLESQLESTNKKINVQSSSWTQSEQKLNEMSKSFKTVGEGLSSVGEEMNTHFTLPIVAGLGIAIKSGADFGHQMADIRKELVASGESTSEVDSTMKEMSDDSLKWGADFGQSTGDINAGLLTLKKDGYSGKEAIDDMSTALYTARGANENLFDVINTLGGSLEAYGMKTENAAKNTQNMAHIADSFAYIANHTKASVTSLGEGFSVAGQTLSAMHQPIEVTAAAIGELASSNIDASTAATALKSGFVNLTKPSDEMSAAMQRMKLNVFDAKGQMKDLPIILDDIEKGTKGWTEEERNNAVATVFGKESLASWNALLNKGGENLRQLSEGAKNSTGEVQRLSDSMKDTPLNKIKELEGSMKALGVTVGEDVLPTFIPLVKDATSAAKGFENLSDSTKGLIVRGAEIVAIAGPIISVTGKTATGISKINNALSKFSGWIGKKVLSNAEDTASTAANTAAEAVNTTATAMNTAAKEANAKAEETGNVAKAASTAATAENTVASAANVAAAGKAAIATAGVAEATEGAGAAAATAAGAGGLGAFATGLGGLVLTVGPWVAGAAAIAGAGYGIYKAYKYATDESIPKMDLFAAKVEQTSQRVQLGEGQTSESFKKQTTTISEETQKAVGAYVKLNDSVTKTEEDIEQNSDKFTTQTKNVVVKNFTDIVNQSSKLDSDMKSNKIKDFTAMVNDTDRLTEQNKTAIVNQYKQMLSQVGGLSDQQKQKLIKNFQDTLKNSIGITQQQVTQMKSKYDQMTQMIDSAVDKRTQHETKSMQDLFSKSTSISSKEQQTILANITKSGDTQKQKISSMEQQILQIYQNAANQHRGLKEDEQQKVNKIQNDMEQNAVQTLSKDEVESKVILQRLKDYNGNITLQQASDTIQNAEKARQGAVQSANDKYNQTVAAIIQERDGTHSISADQADKMIAEAKRQKDESIKKADDMKTGVVNKVKGMNKDIEDNLNTSTGKQLSILEKVKKWWEDWKPGTKNFSIILSTVKGAMGLGFGGFATGTDYAPPGWHWVGEEGPELFNFAGGEQVINAKDSKDITEQMQNAGQAKTSNTTPSTTDQMKNTQLYAENLNTSLGQGITNSVGLVTDPLNQLIAKLNTLMTNFSNKYIGYGQQNVKNLGNGITQNTTLATAPLKTLTSTLGNNLNIFATGAISYGTQTNTSIGNGINNSADVVTNAQKNVTDTLDKNLDTFASNSINYGVNTDTSIGGGITNNSNAVMSAGNKVTTTLGNNLNAFSIGAVKYGQSTDTSISSGINNTVGTVIGSANNLDSQLGNTFATFAQGCTQYGLNAGNSIAEGMRQSEANAVSIAHELVQKILDAITGPEGFDEHSPSRKTTWSGEMAIDGLINGITSKDAAAIFKNKLAPMLGAASALGGNISEWILAGMMEEGAPMSWFLPLEMIASRESGDPGKLGTGNPSLVNNVGVGSEFASGLMQVLPSTFRSFFGSDAGIFNPVMSVRAAIREIRESWGGNPYSITGLMGGGNYLGYASGTDNALAGWRIVGEKGPELEYSPVGGETILNNQDTMSLMNNNSGSNLVKGLADAINSKISMFKNAGESIGTNLIKGAANGVNSSLDVFKKAIDNIGNGISNALNPNKVTEGSLKDFQSWMPDFVDELAKGLKDNSVYINNSALKLGTILADSVMPERNERTKYFEDYNKGAITADKAISQLDVKIKMLKTTTGDYGIDIRNLLGAMTDQSTEINILTGEYNKLSNQYGANSDKATAELKKVEDLRTAYQETGKAVKDLADKLKQSEISDLNDINDKLKEALKQQYEDEKQAAEDQINLTTDTQTKILQAKLDALDIQYQDEDDSDKRSELERQLNMHYGAEKKKELQQELDDLNKDESRRHEKQALQDQINDLKDNNDKMIKNIEEFYSNKLKDANIDAEAQKMLVDNNQKEIVSLLKSYGKDYELAGTSLGNRLVDGLKSSLAVIPDMIDSIKSQINSLKDDMSSLNMSSSSNSVSGSSTQQNAVANSSRPVIENHMHLYIDGKEVAAVTTPYSNKIQGTSFALAQRGLR